MSKTTVIGIDLGGTWLRGSLVIQSGLAGPIISRPIDKTATSEEMWATLCGLIDELIRGNTIQPIGNTIKPIGNGIQAIGIGVPGLVDPDTGIIYDVLNIPSWKEEFPLRAGLEERYRLPVSIDNDANCFAWGEYLSGKGRNTRSMIGLTIGTGLGAGIVLDGKLYTGAGGAAGEFGMIDYLGKNYEYYASGSFFGNVYGLDGEKVFERALRNDAGALKIYAEFGEHLGNAIRTILCSYDTDLILLGGSVSKAWPFFRDSLHRSIGSHAFLRSLRRLRIEISALENSGIIGAAALCSSPSF